MRLIQCAAESAKIEQPFGSPIEGHSHAIEQVDDRRRRLAHCLYRRLVGEEVSAVDGVVKVLPGGVALALQIFGGIDAALRADRVRPLNRDDREEVNLAALLGDLDYGRRACEPATYDNDF